VDKMIMVMLHGILSTYQIGIKEDKSRIKEAKLQAVK